MRNVDVDIYLSQIIRFFDSNPQELKSLIGVNDKQVFYEKIKEKSLENLGNGEDPILTKSQLIEIVVELFNKKTVPQSNLFFKTKFGEICLN